MEASEVLSTPTSATTTTTTVAATNEMSLTPTLQQQQHQQQQQLQLHQQQSNALTLLTAAADTTTTTSDSITTTATSPTTPRTTTHTPREIPTMYILDQMYDDYLDQYNGNTITTPTEEPESNASLELAPCPICSRTFNPVTLRKHVGICEKMALKRRNVFDSQRQRREGTELASYPLPKNFGLPEKNTSSTSLSQARGDRGHSPKPGGQQISSPIMTRKKTSEDLIRSTARASMRKAASSTNNNSTASAAITSPAAASTSSSNLVRDRLRSSERSLTRRGATQTKPAEQCPHCERCFGIKAYDRHVEWCKEKALQAAIKVGYTKTDGNVAKARLEARTKYRAPCLKTKRSMNREKYSGMPGDDLDMEDSSKCSKTSNKAQENSLMSMSMTSSMCSERKITNSTTGNIKEPVAMKKAQTSKNNNKDSVGSRKNSRDRRQISRQPTPPPPLPQFSTKSQIAREAAEAAAADQERGGEPIINLEFHVMGEEQMTANVAINNKKQQRIKATTITKSKMEKNPLTAAAKLKNPKQKPEKSLQKILKKSNHLLTTTDLELNLPNKDHSKILEQKKSASDLSLRSMRSTDQKLLQQESQRSFDRSNDHSKAKEESRDHKDFKQSRLSYGSSKGFKENDMEEENSSLRVTGKQMNYSRKMSLKEYFEGEETFEVDNVEDSDTQHQESDYMETRFEMTKCLAVSSPSKSSRLGTLRNNQEGIYMEETFEVDYVEDSDTQHQESDCLESRLEMAKCHIASSPSKSVALGTFRDNQEGISLDTQIQESDYLESLNKMSKFKAINSSKNLVTTRSLRDFQEAISSDTQKQESVYSFRDNEEGISMDNQNQESDYPESPIKMSKVKAINSSRKSVTSRSFRDFQEAISPDTQKQESRHSESTSEMGEGLVINSSRKSATLRNFKETQEEIFPKELSITERYSKSMSEMSKIHIVNSPRKLAAVRNFKETQEEITPDELSITEENNINKSRKLKISKSFKNPLEGIKEKSKENTSEKFQFSNRLKDFQEGITEKFYDTEDNVSDSPREFEIFKMSIVKGINSSRKSVITRSFKDLQEKIFSNVQKQESEYSKNTSELSKGYVINSPIKSATLRNFKESQKEITPVELSITEENDINKSRKFKISKSSKDPLEGIKEKSKENTSEKFQFSNRIKDFQEGITDKFYETQDNVTDRSGEFETFKPFKDIKDDDFKNLIMRQNKRLQSETNENFDKEEEMSGFQGEEMESTRTKNQDSKDLEIIMRRSQISKTSKSYNDPSKEILKSYMTKDKSSKSKPSKHLKDTQKRMTELPAITKDHFDSSSPNLKTTTRDPPTSSYSRKVVQDIKKSNLLQTETNEYSEKEEMYGSQSEETKLDITSSKSQESDDSEITISSQKSKTFKSYTDLQDGISEGFQKEVRNVDTLSIKTHESHLESEIMFEVTRGLTLIDSRKPKTSKPFKDSSELVSEKLMLSKENISGRPETSKSIKLSKDLQENILDGFREEDRNTIKYESCQDSELQFEMSKDINNSPKSKPFKPLRDPPEMISEELTMCKENVSSRSQTSKSFKPSRDPQERFMEEFTMTKENADSSRQKKHSKVSIASCRSQTSKSLKPTRDPQERIMEEFAMTKENADRSQRKKLSKSYRDSLEKLLENSFNGFPKLKLIKETQEASEEFMMTKENAADICKLKLSKSSSDFSQEFSENSFKGLPKLELEIQEFSSLSEDDEFQMLEIATPLKTKAFDKVFASDEADLALNPILKEIPKLKIPKSPSKAEKHSKNIPKITKNSLENKDTTKKRVQSKASYYLQEQIELKPKSPLPNELELAQGIMETKDYLSEAEIFKDCLTDSDELRRCKEILKTQETTQIKEEILNTTSKSLVKSNTFIRNSEQSAHERYLLMSQTINSKSSEDLASTKSKTTKPLIMKISKRSKKEALERNVTPRTPKSVRLVRLSSPSPANRTEPTTPHAESQRPKSLSLTQPKRRKVLRPTSSCTSTLPMKATSLDICGVVSTPHIEHGRPKKSGREVKEELEQQREFGGEVQLEEKKKKAMDKEIKVIKEPPPQLKRNKSFTVRGLPDNYDPFLSAKRQLEELCSTTSDNIDIPTTTTAPRTPLLPSMPATPNTSSNRMSTSLILSSSTPITTPNTLMTTSQIPQQTQTQKTPTLARSSSFKRTSSLRGPRRSPMLSSRPPLFAQKHRPTIQRGLSDEGPISSNFLKPEEYDEMPVRSVCVNDFALNKSPRVVRRDTSSSNRKQPLKLNINAANANSSSATASPNIRESETEILANNTASKYVSKTDSLAVFLKYEHELEKLNSNAADIEHKIENIAEVKTPPTAPVTNLDGPLSTKELKDKSNNLSKQNSAKNIKADLMAACESPESQYENPVNDLDAGKYSQNIRLAPLSSKPSTPLTKPSTPLLQQHLNSTQMPALMVKNIALNQEGKAPNTVALSSLFAGGDNKNLKNSNHAYAERKTSPGSDYIDPKLINKCDNLPINLNLKRNDFKHSDSDASELRLDHFSSSSSDSSAPAKKSTSLNQHTKFLPNVKQPPLLQHPTAEPSNNNPSSHSNTNSQRNSAEGRNLLKRRMRLGRNHFLYDASPEGDSCSADDEGANRSSMEGDRRHPQQHQHHHQQDLLREHEKAFERFNTSQVSHVEPPFIPPLPAFDDFDFEEFLSSFENDEEQFPLFKDCREFLMNRTSKKQRSMLLSNSSAPTTQNPNSTTNTNSTNFKKSSSPQTFPPLTPQSSNSVNSAHHFQFPSLPQHPKSLFNSFSLNARARNKYDELMASTKSSEQFSGNLQREDFKDHDQKREIFISIETEQNDLDKSPISPNSIRNMVGNPQTVVEVEVDAAHDNKFSKISDDDTEVGSQNLSRSKNFTGLHLQPEHLPNVQLNNAKNLIQKMQDDFRQMGEEMSGNLRMAMEQRTSTAPVDMNMNSNANLVSNTAGLKVQRLAGVPSGDAYGDSDDLSSLDGYPLSSPNSRLGVSSKTSADSAYGSLSRQRSSELSSQRTSSRSRALTSNNANTLMNRPLTEESTLGRSRQLSASSSSSSEHNLPPIAKSNSYHKPQQQLPQQQQQSLYNNNNISNNLEDRVLYERNNNYDLQPLQNTLTGTTNSHTNLESLQQYPSNSTMSTSMKMSKFCHECGSKFLLDQAKFCMDCGIKRIVL